MSPRIQPNDIINCPAAPNTSVHLYWTPSEHHGPTCVGNHQYYVFGAPRPKYASLCAGNNYGFEEDARGFHSYDAGNHFGLYGYSANLISNQGWRSSVHATCSFYG
jgi:hypothetical protein